MNKWLIAALVATVVAAAIIITVSMNNISYTKLLDKGIHEKTAANLKSAKKAFKEAIEMRPDSAEAYYYLGSVYLAEKNSKKAKAELDKAIELDDSKAAYYVELSFVYFNLMDEREKAILEMEKAIKLDPDDYQYRVAMGIYLEKVEKNKEAIEHFEKAYDLEPSLAGIQERLITLYKKTGELEKAKKLTGERESTETKEDGSFIETKENTY